MEFQKGFFEFIAAADAEKVHSQTIGWMLSGNCKAFDFNQRNSILLSLCGESKQIINELIIEEVEVEVDHIDILIRCEDRFVVIENKIKSSEHSNQLDKYEYITAHDEKNSKEAFDRWKKKENNTKGKSSYKPNKERYHKVSKEPIYIYLTLIEEEPVGGKNWGNITYKKLYDILKEQLSKEPDPLEEKKDWLIVYSYLNTIKNLTDVINKFRQNPKSIPHVFEEGKTSTRNMAKNEDWNTSYIRETKLETYLQGLFYRDILYSTREGAENVKYICEKYGIDKKQITISETRGWALMDFHLGRIQLKEKNYNLILQFQGQNIKFAITSSLSQGDGKKNDVLDQESSQVNNEINSIKEAFAKKLEIIEIINERFGLQGISQDKKVNILIKKISTPRSPNGFFSIRIQDDSKHKYWQIAPNIKPIEIIEEYLSYAFTIMKGFAI